MAQKRKATLIKSTPPNDEGEMKTIRSSNAQASDPTETGRKKRKIDQKDRESPEDKKDAGHEENDKQKNLADSKRSTMPSTTNKADTRGRPEKPAAQAKPRKKELKNDVIKSRDEALRMLCDAEAENQKFKAKIHKMSSRLEQQHETIRTLEGLRIAATGQDRIYFQDDDIILENVKLFFGMVSKWALNWAHKGFLMAHMTEAIATTTLKMLQGHSKHFETRILREMAGLKCAWASATCRLTTEAFLAHMISECFLVRPFNILIRNESGEHANMEDYVNKVCDGMRKDNQTEPHLWISTTLRAYYSPDQYADNMTKPITNDHFQDDRLRTYNSAISEWISSTNSPLAPLLRPCQESELQDRTMDMLKILHAAGRLSVQLWVQSSKVAIIGNMHRGNDAVHKFDDQTATLHSLMPTFEDPEDLHDHAVDLIVWPRLQITKFNSVYPHGRRPIITKASIIIYDLKSVRANMKKLEDGEKVSVNAVTTQASIDKTSIPQERKEVRGGVDEQAAQPSVAPANQRTNGPDEGLYQNHQMSTRTVSGRTQKDLVVDKLLADSTESASKQTNSPKSPATKSKTPKQNVIDLTDESEPPRSEEQPQEPQKAASQEQEFSRNEGPPSAVPTDRSLFSELTHAASMLPESYNFRPAEHEQPTETQTQNPSMATTNTDEQSTDRDSEEGEHKEELLKLGAASRTSSLEPQESQNQPNDATLAEAYDFTEPDPTIEELSRSFELQPHGHDADDQHGTVGEETLANAMDVEEESGSAPPDPIDSVTAANEDDDTIMVVIPSELATATEKPQDDVKDDLGVDLRHSVDVDEEKKPDGVDMDAGRNDVHESAEPATENGSTNRGQNGVGEPTAS